MQFQTVPQIRERFFFGLALTGDIDFQALRNVPISFAPDGRGEGSLHGLILSQGGSAYGIQAAATRRASARTAAGLFYSSSGQFGSEIRMKNGDRQHRPRALGR
jgi:hypothetical protein